MMKVSVLRGVEDVAVQERDIPPVGPNDVLVKVASVGVCGSDVHYYEHGKIGSFVVDSPLVLGHEAGGTISAVGTNVTSLSVGQRVSLEPGVPCLSCQQCLTGHYNLCPDVAFFATPPHDGAFAEFVSVPAAFTYPIPDSMSDDAAGLIEPLSVGVWACQRAQVAPGSTVLVTGAGPIGLIAAQAARAYGATSVAISDVNPQRLALAERLGFRAINVAQASLAEAGIEPDVLLECSGNGRATWDAISIMARAGRVVLVGMGGDTVQLPLSHVQDRELVITGAFRYANTWPVAIDLVASGQIDLDAVVTHHFPLAEVEAALQAGREDPAAVKVMVLPGS
ncbi:NAD(P)-dependent alcohol dehydrogenase [Ornithinimicrobium sp. INDO-MA30-4]|uniref:NAD(P)-dependent alcohol dehydrogenase n=1 Tax=Ornithinimicrobium sp. INDO-MA30-4 TaxID=2908651 RepID=UPI002882D564|nr:NAD(P)-dependent alcohol dehydrogenase [Ornithinimicrobium sp. INDO-MA30-4]